MNTSLSTHTPYNVTLNGRTYHIVDFRSNEWTIERDEKILDLLDPVLDQILKMITPQQDGKVSFTFDFGVIYSLLRTKKIHREILACLFSPDNGDVKDEQYIADIAKLGHADIEEAFTRFLVSVKSFGRGSFRISLGEQQTTEMTTTA